MRFLPKEKKSNIKGNSKGFTLIELMIVVAIISILSAAAAMSFTRARDTARIGACKASVDGLRKGLEDYITENPGYPEGIGSYEELMEELKDHITANNHDMICDFESYNSDDGSTYELVSKVIRSSGDPIRLTATPEGITEEPW